MNFKTTLILLVLLVAAGAYVIYDRTIGRQKDQVEVVNNKKLFDVKDPADINSLTIKSSEGGEIVLSRVNEKWRMTKPFEAAAESLQVNELLTDLVSLQSTGGVEAKDTGLDNPRFKIEMSAKGGKNLRFSIGNKTQLGQMFLKVDGSSQAQLVSAEVYERLAKPANDLHDKQLVAIATTDIKQMTIDSDGQKLVLQKMGAQWQLTAPQALPVDETVITDLLGAVTGLRAAEWIAKDSSDIGKAQFDKPLMTVTFSTAAPTTQPASAPTSQPNSIIITFGQYEDVRRQKQFARLSDGPAVVKVAAQSMTTLTKKPLELRDRRVADINPDHVSKISITSDLPAGPAPTLTPGKKTTVEIERRKIVAAAPATKPASTQAATKPATTQASTAPATTQTAIIPPPPSKWELKSDPKGDGDDESITNLLTDLHPLRVTKYLEPGSTTKPTAGYVVKIRTEAPGGAGGADHLINIIDPGGDLPLRGDYNGLSFELGRTILARLEGNFAKKPKPTTPVNPDAQDFKLPGEK